jgi:hypothetical protein
MVQPQSLPLRIEPPSGPPESLSGLIERVTFHNEDRDLGVGPSSAFMYVPPAGYKYQWSPN